jgi:hypothetical protein
VQPARARLERAASGVGLDAAAPAARTQPAAHAHDHVTDLAGVTAAAPAPALEHDAAADARPPPHAQEGRPLRARAELRFGVERDADVVAQVHGTSQRFRELRAEQDLALEAHQVARSRDGAACRVDGARAAHADPVQVGQLRARIVGRGAHALGQGLDDAPRSAVVRRRSARAAQDAPVCRDDDRLDLRAAQVDAAARSHGALDRVRPAAT